MTPEGARAEAIWRLIDWAQKECAGGEMCRLHNEAIAEVRALTRAAQGAPLGVDRVENVGNPDGPLPQYMVDEARVRAIAERHQAFGERYSPGRDWQPASQMHEDLGYLLSLLASRPDRGAGA